MNKQAAQAHAVDKLLRLVTRYRLPENEDTCRSDWMESVTDIALAYQVATTPKQLDLDLNGKVKVPCNWKGADNELD